MSTICFYAQFVASKVGVNSLTVTWDVEQITRSDGTRSALVTGGATTITVGRRGLYGYRLANADLSLYDYVATAITATTTVDQQEIAAIGMVIPDALVSVVETDTADIQTRLPAALVSGRMDASAGAMAANVITAAALAEDAVTEIAGAILVTPGNKLATVPGGAVSSVAGDVAGVSGNVYGKVLGGGSGTITGTGVQATISGTLTTLDALWAKIQKWLRLGYRKDAFVATDHATELAEINANTGSGVGTYTSMTDSVEAQRDNVGTAGAGLTALGDTRLAHLDEDVSSVGGGGAGTGTYSDTVTDGADPIDNVLVQLSTDAAGTNMVYRTYSAADGTFTLYPDPGTYYVWLELAGYSFTQGAQVVVT